MVTLQARYIITFDECCLPYYSMLCVYLYFNQCLYLHDSGLFKCKKILRKRQSDIVAHTDSTFRDVLKTALNGLRQNDVILARRHCDECNGPADI